MNNQKPDQTRERLDMEVIKNAEALYRQLGPLTDGKPWDEERYWKNVRFHLDQGWYHWLKAGQYLLVLKKMLPPAEFKRKCSLKIGISEMQANNYISYIQTYFELKIPEKLIDRTKQFHLLMLGKLPQEFKEEIKEKQTLAGKPVEELIAFSRKELDEYIRSVTLEAEEKLRLKEEELEKKNREIEKLNIEKKIVEIELSKVRGEIPKEFSKSIAMMDAILAQMQRLRETLIEQQPTADELTILQDHVETLRLLLSHIEPLIRPNSLMANPKYYNPIKTDVTLQRINNDSRFDFSKLDSEEIDED